MSKKNRASSRIFMVQTAETLIRDPKKQAVTETGDIRTIAIPFSPAEPMADKVEDPRSLSC